MSEYPSHKDGLPPIISLKDYDTSEWSKSTCVDPRADGFYVVDMQHPEKTVAKIDPKDNEILDRIVKSSMETYKNQ